MLESNPQVVPTQVALVCHPHPLYGGTMHNKVVFRAAKAALHLGIPVLRFNFRGAGKSAGTFAYGAGEREDVRAALDYLSARFPELPVCLIGFSFGAWVGMAVGAADLRVCTLIGLGVPVASNDFIFLRAVGKPKMIIQGTRDEFGPRAEVQALYDALQDPKRIYWVEDADHFFTGKLDEVQEALRQFLSPIVSNPM